MKYKPKNSYELISYFNCLLIITSINHKETKTVVSGLEYWNNCKAAWQITS